MTHGSRLVVVPAELSRSPADFLRLLAWERVTVLSQTPSAFYQLMQADSEDKETSGKLVLRSVVLGGEALDTGRLRDWYDRHPDGAALVNMYGITETTVHVSYAALGPGSAALGGSVIGRGLPGLGVYVLDAHLRPVPAGVTGELHVAGGQLARGYLGQPGLTAGRFIPDLFAGDGSRMYRTGDLARRNAAGQLEFLGRADNQVKVRGFRVEPGEIEAVLVSDQRVAQAVVVAREDRPGDKRLVAYLVPADAGVGVPAAGELRGFLGERMPEFMVPSVFVELAGLPLTPNGKLDRAALPVPEGVRPDLGAGFVAPAGPVQELLAGIWAQVLGTGRVGAGDSFFELGGHSLLAAQVISRIRAVFGVEVPLAALFDQPTVAGLAAVIENAAPGVAVPPVTAVSRDRALPLSFGQQRLWFLDQLEPGSAEYNIPSPVRLAGDLDVPALAAALSAVVARHEVLRTRLVAGPDGIPYQVIDPPAEFPLPLADVSGEPDPVVAAGVLVAADADTPFDLAAGPPVRATLIRLGADDHVLALSVHHVVSDEWSAAIFRRELSALYAAFSTGQPDPLPALPVQYADFAVWQRRWLAGEVLDSQLAYWRDQLAGLPVVELPADRPRPPVRSSAGAVTEFSVPAEVAERLRVLARENGVTMFMTLFAAYAVLLGRYAGQDDIVAGTPVANRNTAETEALIGFFVNTLVLRADLSGDPLFTELLGRVRAMALGAYAHQDLPFEQLVDALVTDRDRSRTPLFQAFFSYARAAADADTGAGGARPALGDARIEEAGVARQTTLFDLIVAVADTEQDTLAGSVEYSTALFDAPTAERIAGHLLALLDAVAADPGRPLHQLPMLTARERGQLARWNDTAVPEQAASVLELVAASAARRPDTPAVTCNDVTLTYRELQTRASRLAHRMRRSGVGPETIVGLHLDNGPDMVAAMLAVLQAGGAYLPMDPGYPAGRLAFMLADSGATVLVGDHRLARLPAGGITHRVELADPTTSSSKESQPCTPPPGPPAHHDQLAYIIYTSGSTGRPRGVMVSQGSLANLVEAQRQDLDLADADITLQVASFSFDVAGSEVFAPRAAGAHIVIADAQTRRSAPALQHLLAANAITVAQFTASALQTLDPGGLPDLRVLVSGGEPCPPALAESWAGGRRFINAYGPTETTVCATLAVNPSTTGPLAIGRPIRNARAYVLDRSMQAVPVGVPGELCVAGAGVARGYRHRPGLTAERFVADPFAGDGSRLYRTGDRVRYRADGQLDFLGRDDQQVKLRGNRVEPGEIEAALAAHPRVAAVVVVLHDDESSQRLVAYLVPTDPAEGVPGAGELRGFLGERLPDHMIPAAFIELAGLPLTPNGKLDRAALPAPGGARPELGGEFVAPATPAQELLAGIWAQVLRLDRVGAEDSFFELGGHSLLATQVISRIRGVFDVEVPLAALFDKPTVAGLAAVIEGATPGITVPPVVPACRDRVLPLSFAQQRLWFLDQLEPGSAEYNMPMPGRLRGRLDVPALAAALTAITARHEVLRTRLAAGPDGVPHQVIDPPAPFPLPVADVSDTADPMAAAQALVAADAVAPFDLAAGPLIRATLIRLRPGDHILALSAHHVVFDEWSAGILRRELGLLYDAFRAGRPDPLPPLPVQYADFAIWQRQWLAGEVLDAQLAYWRRQLAGVPVLDLPTDRPRPPAWLPTGAATAFTVCAETAGRLRVLAGDSGVTMFMTLFAVYAVLLGRYAGVDDVVAGTPVANRNRAETEDLIGFFVNALVLRADLAGDPAFTELLGRVRAMALGAYAHQDLPFEQLVDALVADRDRSRTPLF